MQIEKILLRGRLKDAQTENKQDSVLCEAAVLTDGDVFTTG